MADFKFYGIPYIYTDKKSNPDTVIEIYKQTKAEASDILEHIKNLLIFIRATKNNIFQIQIERLTKNVVNYIKHFLTVVSILFHKPVSYVSRKKNKNILMTLILLLYMNDEGESDLNIATGTDMLVNGIGFQYCLQQGEETNTILHSH